MRGCDLVVADDLHVQRRRQAEIQRLAHNVGRQKIKHACREIRGSARMRSWRT